MLTYKQMSLQTIKALLFVILVLPSTLSMSLTNLENMEDGHAKEDFIIPMLTKRHISGSDPWSLCPHGMERVDCFYEYLRLYARLRQVVERENTVTVRNIGKRTDYSSTPRSSSPPAESLRIAAVFVYVS